MKLTKANYYKMNANKEYISVSQYKDFWGTLAYEGCEAQAMAKLKGLYKPEPTAAMLIGSYVDSYFEGTLEKFKKNHPEIMNTRTGELKADFKNAEQIIERIKRDSKFMRYLSGQKQVIMTGELFGAQWKIKIDSYIPDTAIVDLKVVKDIHERIYTKNKGYVSFAEANGYDFQLAVYQKIVEYNTGKRLPCYIAAADKGKPADIEIIYINQEELDNALIGAQYGVERILELKAGKEPDRCGRCEYCKEAKVITRPVTMAELIE